MYLDITSRRNYTAPALLGPSTITNHTTVASAILDCEGADGAEITVHTGVVTGWDGGTNNCTAHLQESDTINAADFADVALTDMVRVFGGVQSTDALPLKAISQSKLCICRNGD